MNEAKETFKPIPTSIPNVKGNTITKATIDLGRMLFFDPRLSASHLISCNTRYNVGMGGGDNLETFIGHGWAKGPRNALTAINAVLNIAQFWDSRAEDLKAQANGPIQAGVEMDNTPAMVETTLKSMPDYVDSFKKAFPGEKAPVSFDNMARAIEAFEATLTPPGSRFDTWKAVPLALNAEEKKGLRLFLCIPGRSVA